MSLQVSTVALLYNLSKQRAATRAVTIFTDWHILSLSVVPGRLQAQPGILPVLYHGELLLASGGGSLPAHPPGGRPPPEQVLPGLPSDRMG